MAERPRQAGVEDSAQIAEAFVRGLERPGMTGDAVSRALIADGPLLLPDDFWFTREIFGRQAVVTGINNCLCVVLARGDLVLRRGSSVSSWAYGDTVRIAADCAILGAISARRDLLLTPPCRFTRVSGRHVRFGPGAHAGVECPGRCARAAPASGGRTPRLIEGGLQLAAGEVLEGDVVVRGDVKLDRRARVTGKLEAHGHVLLCAESAVDGALIGRQAVAIGARCELGGPVAAERSIDLGPSAVVGCDERPTTVVAPFVRACAGAVVHGTVRAWLEGEASPSC